MLLLLHKTLKGSRNIQGFALIRAVLFTFKLFIFFKKANGFDSCEFQKNCLTLLGHFSDLNDLLLIHTLKHKKPLKE